MKKTFLILSFTFLFFFLFMPKDTFALTENYTNFGLGSYDLNQEAVTISTAGTRNFNIQGGALLDSNVQSGSSHDYLYYKVAFCSSAEFYNYGPSTNTDQVYRQQTPYSCKIQNKGNGNVIFMYFRVKVPVKTYAFDAQVSFTVNQAPFNLQLMYYQTSNHAFDFDEVDSVNILQEIAANTAQFQTTGQGIKESVDKTNDKLDDLNDNITNSDTSDSQSSAGSFFEDFTSDDYGLSDIITMPLTFIKGLSNASCYSLDLPFPFVEQNVQIPCMTSIYENYFGSFLTLYQTITTGFIAYWVCVNIYRLVKNFKNPDDDKVEVMEL